MEPIKNQIIPYISIGNNTPMKVEVMRKHKYIGYLTSSVPGGLGSYAVFLDDKSLKEANYTQANSDQIKSLFRTQIRLLNTAQDVRNLESYFVEALQNLDSEKIISNITLLVSIRIRTIHKNLIVKLLNESEEKGDGNFSEVEKLLKQDPSSPINIDAYGSDGRTALMEAISQKKKKQVEFLLSHGASPWTEADNLSSTAFHYAVQVDDPTLLETLIKYDKTQHYLTYIDRSGHSLVHVAAAALKHSNLRLLIKLNCRTDGQNQSAETPLHLACKNDTSDKEAFNESVRILLEAGVSLTAKDSLGKTALYYAAANSHFSNELFEEMIKSGADHLEDGLLYQAIESGRVENAEFIMKRALTDKKMELKDFSNLVSALKFYLLAQEHLDWDRSEYLTPLLTRFNFPQTFWNEIITDFISENKIMEFKFIYNLMSELEKKVSLPQPYFTGLFNPNTEGNTIVHIAAEGQSVEIMQILAEEKDHFRAASALINAQGRSPLLIAMNKENPSENTKKIVQILFSVYKPDLLRLPLLLLSAAQGGHWDSLEALLTRQVKETTNISQKTADGNNLLHILLQSPLAFSRKSINLVLQHPNPGLLAQDKNGRTPLELCVSECNGMESFDSLVKALEKQKNLETALQRGLEKDMFLQATLCALEHPEDVRVFDAFIELLLKHPDFKVFEVNNQSSAFLQAAIYGNRHVFEQLIRLIKFYKMDYTLLYSTGRLGVTPLHLAAKHNDEGLLQLFPGCPELADMHGDTPLHYAAFYKAGRSLQYLLKHGADCNKQAKNGQTALHYSAHSNHSEGVTILLKAGAKLDIQDSKGMTPLEVAVVFGAREAITSLLIGVEGENGTRIAADCNIPQKDGSTLLHKAAKLEYFDPSEGRRGFRTVVDVMKGANIAAVDRLGRIPLDYAVIAGIMTNVVFLVNSSPNPRKAIEHKDNEGKNAFMHAFENNQLHLMPFLIENAPPQIYKYLIRLFGNNLPLDPNGGEAWESLLITKGISPKAFCQEWQDNGLLDVCLVFHDVNFAKWIFKQLGRQAYNPRIEAAINFLVDEYSDSLAGWLKMEGHYFNQGIEVAHTPSPKKTPSAPLNTSDWEASKQTILAKAAETVKMSGRDNYLVVSDKFTKTVNDFLKKVDAPIATSEIEGLRSLTLENSKCFLIDLKNTLYHLANCLKNSTDGLQISQSLQYIYESANICNEGFAEGATQALALFQGCVGFPVEEVLSTSLKHSSTDYINSKKKIMAFVGNLSLQCVNKMTPLQKDIKGGTQDHGIVVHVGNQLKRVVRQRVTLDWNGIGSGEDSHLGNFKIIPNVVNNTFDKFFTADYVIKEFQKQLNRAKEIRNRLDSMRTEISTLEQQQKNIAKDQPIDDEGKRKQIESLEQKKKQLEVAKKESETAKPALKKELNTIMSPVELYSVLEIAVGQSVSEYYNEDEEISEQGLILVLKELGVLRDVDFSSVSAICAKSIPAAKPPALKPSPQSQERYEHKQERYEHKHESDRERKHDN